MDAPGRGFVSGFILVEAIFLGCFGAKWAFLTI